MLNIYWSCFCTFIFTLRWSAVGAFSSSKAIVRLPDLWPWLCTWRRGLRPLGSASWLLSGPDGWSWWQRWQMAVAAPRSLAELSYPQKTGAAHLPFVTCWWIRHLHTQTHLYDTEGVLSWVGRDPGLIPRSKHGQLQRGIRPLLETLPSRVVNIS